MESWEHTFPLPDLETHKLDVVQHEIDELEHPVKTFLRKNKWSLLAFGALGVAIRLGWRRRK